MSEFSRETFVFSVIFMQANVFVSALYFLVSIFCWLIDNFWIVSDAISVMITKFCGNQFVSYVCSGVFLVI